MDKEIHSFGPNDGLNFTFELGGGDDTKPLFGRLGAWIGSSLVWGNESLDGKTTTGVEWYWQDLLLHLSQVLHVIALEEAYPLGLEPVVPQLLAQAARERWYGLSDKIVDDEEETLLAFEERHDLSRGVSGCSLSPLFLLRQGAGMIIATNHGVRYRPAREVLKCLADVGDFLAGRAENGSSEESRAVAVQWRSRPAQEKDEERSAELVSALPRDRLRKIAGSISLKDFWRLGNVDPTENAYLIAARMTSGELSDHDMRDLLRRLREVESSDSASLSYAGLAELSDAAAGQLRHSQQAYSQGYELGIWMRQRLSLPPDRNVDIQRTLERLGVAIREIELSTDIIDAILLWRKTEAPTVIVNRIGKRSRFPRGKRASLAHELCHLLLDRNGAFPVVEMQGGRLPRWPEQRANAFAAEFLLPRSAISDAPHQDDMVNLLDYLSDTFDVSHELAAWQILNSRLALGKPQKDLLESYTRNV